MTAEVAQSIFTWPVRIYWEDTDAGGVVYYANYLKFMERARSEWLRSLGFEQGPLKEHAGIILVIAHIDVSYRHPARYGDLLQVTTKLLEAGRASLRFEQHIYRDLVGGELLVEGRARAACVDPNSFKPKPLPKNIAEKLSI